MFGRGLVVLALIAGCGGGDAEEEGCEAVKVQFDVTDPQGDPLDGAEVSFSEPNSIELVPCTGGNGTYTCEVPGEGEYQFYVEAYPMYEAWGSRLTIAEPESCDAVSLTTPVQLQAESGGI